MKPPFRADHVGSLLRPPELLKSKRDREIQDRAIRAVVKKQEAIGLESITDGELRRAMQAEGLREMRFRLDFEGSKILMDLLSGEQYRDHDARLRADAGNAC